jgi:hypothetical protein
MVRLASQPPIEWTSQCPTASAQHLFLYLTIILTMVYNCDYRVLKEFWI